MVKWTARDQQMLDKLQNQRAEFMLKTRTPLVNMVYSLPYVSERMIAEKIADDLIARADEFRDLLAPFDSGVRCATPEDGQ